MHNQHLDPSQALAAQRMTISESRPPMRWGVA